MAQPTKQEKVYVCGILNNHRMVPMFLKFASKGNLPTIAHQTNTVFAQKWGGTDAQCCDT
mgnify:CR=1 FL=1